MNFNVGDVLRDIRLNRRMTQQEIADRLGVSRASYSLWENNRRSPKKENCQAICDSFKISMDNLLGFRFAEKNDSKNKSIALFDENGDCGGYISIPNEFVDHSKKLMGKISNKTITVYDVETNSPMYIVLTV